MKLLSNIYIHPLTILLFFISFLTGYAKYLFFIFLIVTIHELGHILIAKILKRKITKVELLPFGGLTKIDSYVSANIFEDLLIAAGGLLTQTLFGFYLNWLTTHYPISPSTYIFLKNFNITIIIFNILPICPLDGYKILKLITELFTPFRTSFKVAEFISFSFLGLIFFLKFELVKDNIFIFTFIIYMIIDEIKSKKYIFNRFYLERINHTFNYRLKHIKDYKQMYKNRIHFIKGIHEKIILNELFTRKTH